jgi:hypothetical protein
MALFALPAAVLADAVSDARKQIQAAYDRENAAAARKDTSGVMANLMPDYISINYRGQRTNAEQLRHRLPQLFAMAMSIKGRTRITRLALKGSQADVTAKEHGEVTLMNPRTGKPTNLVVDETSQTLWVKTARGWKKKRSRTIASKQSVDGKPFTPPARPQP